LLRVLEDSELSSEREDAILEELLAAPAPKERPRAVVWPWLLAALGVSALALVIGFDRLGANPAPEFVAELPEPSVELLTAQAARFEGEESAEYRSQMADYRRQVFAVLRHGEGQ